jgi:hypothetical protein
MPTAAPDQSERNGERWAAHPVLASVIMLCLYAVPLGVSMLAVLAVARVNPVAGHRWLSYGLLGGTALGVSMALERSMRRLLPIAALLRLTMLFPDRAPSRFKVARTAASSTRLQALDTSSSVSDAAESALALMAALGTHDRRTRGHSERVRVFGDMLAEQLKLDQGDRDRLRWASLLHDIGKLQIPATVLNKPAKLDRGEFELMKTHPEIGADLTAALLPWLGDWSRGILEHHEKYDGSGYPSGLAESAISPSGRIIGLVDAFETMTAARSYKKAMATRTARTELARCAGTHFDPVLVRAFLGVSLPRLIWAMGPFTFLLQLPFLRVIAQAGTRTVAAGDVAATVAGAAAIAGVGVTGAYAGVDAPRPPVPARVASHVAPAPAVVGPTAPAGPRRVPAAPTAAPAPLAPMATAAPTPTDLPSPSPAALTPTPEAPVVGPTVPEVPPVLGPTIEPTTAPPAPEPVATPTVTPTLPPLPTLAPEPPPVVGPSVPPVIGPTVPPVVGPTPPPPPLVILSSAPTGTVTTSDVSLAFTSNDPAATFSCAVDGGPWQACGAPTGYTLPNGAHTVAVRAESLNGVGPATTTSFTVAAPAPVVTVSAPTAPVRADTADVRFTSDQAGSTFECSVDSGPWSSCTTPLTLAGLTGGAHTVDVRATSALTGQGAAARGTFIVDLAPRATIDSGPTAGSTWPSTQVTLALGSDDPGATFQCSLDGTTFSACTDTPTFTIPNGPGQIWVRAVSAAHGTGPVVTTGAFTVAQAAPRIFLANLPGAFTYDPVTFDVTTDDPQATVTCSLDGSTPVPCSGSQSYAALANGPHTVTVVAADAATGSTSQSFSFTSVTAPTVTITSAGIAGADATVTFTGSNATAYECSLDGGAWSACTSPATFAGLPTGTHVVSVRGIGPAGPGAADQTGPMTTGSLTTFTTAPTGTVIRTTQTFAIPAVPGATYECAIDGGAFVTCTNPADLTFSLGTHTVQMRAVVLAVAQSPATTTFTVVSSFVALTSAPPVKASVKTATFTFAGAAGLTFQCGLDGGWAPCTSPATYAGLTNGLHTFRVRVVDSSGAFGSAMTYSWQVT